MATTNSSTLLPHELPLLLSLLSHATVSSISPETGAYVSCANFLLEACNELLRPNCKGSEVILLPNAPPTSPVVVFKWPGTSPTLPHVLLNGHYDVVPPGDLDKWTHPPFEATCKDDVIRGRGIQDMKSVIAQYISSLHRLATSGFTPSRTIIMTLVPDEEIGGAGMADYLASDFFKSNGGVEGVGIALDEGLASENDVYNVYYGERAPWWVTVTANGSVGHGSRFIEPTAMEQIINVSRRALDFRKEQKDALFGEGKHAGCSHAVAASKKKTIGDVTSLNITTMQAGVDAGNGVMCKNMVPPTATATFDIRISPNMEPTEMKEKLDLWCRECEVPGGELKWGFFDSHNNMMTHHTTPIDQTWPWFSRFQAGVGKSDIAVLPGVFPAATDSRFLRALGIRALGFSPMRNSEILLHEYNESLRREVYEEGLEVYVKLIEHLASVADDF